MARKAKVAPRGTLITRWWTRPPRLKTCGGATKSTTSSVAWSSCRISILTTQQKAQHYRRSWSRPVAPTPRSETWADHFTPLECFRTESHIESKRVIFEGKPVHTLVAVGSFIGGVASENAANSSLSEPTQQSRPWFVAQIARAYEYVELRSWDMQIIHEDILWNVELELSRGSLWLEVEGAGRNLIQWYPNELNALWKSLLNSAAVSWSPNVVSAGARGLRDLVQCRHSQSGESHTPSYSSCVVALQPLPPPHCVRRAISLRNSCFYQKWRARVSGIVAGAAAWDIWGEPVGISDHGKNRIIFSG